MNVRFQLYRIRRKLQSRMKLREVMRKVDWLEFENESILNFLAKYDVVASNHETTQHRQRGSKIQNFGNTPKLVINVLETSNH